MPGVPVTPPSCFVVFFFFNDTAPTEISPLPLPDALPIFLERRGGATARRLRLAHVLLERFQLRAPLQGPPRSAPGRGTAVQEHGAVRPPQRRPRPSEIGRAHV